MPPKRREFADQMIAMLMLLIALYVLCALAFYLQMMSHGRLHATTAEEPTAPQAEIIELFPGESKTGAA